MTLVTESQLRNRGEELGLSLPPGSILMFRGEVGAGKTTFIKAIASGLGVKSATASPTFALQEIWWAAPAFRRVGRLRRRSRVG